LSGPEGPLTGRREPVSSGATGAPDAKEQEMDTKEQLAPEVQVVNRPSRRGPVAVIAAVLLAGALAIGFAATRSTEPATKTASAISVAAGRTQPATLIHRVSMQGAATTLSVPKGRTQPATTIYRISFSPAPIGSGRAH
jgi:hypothetical protein